MPQNVRGHSAALLPLVRCAYAFHSDLHSGSASVPGNTLLRRNSQDTPYRVIVPYPSCLVPSYHLSVTHLPTPPPLQSSSSTLTV